MNRKEIKEGKKGVGIVLAAIMLVTVFVATVPTVASNISTTLYYVVLRFTCKQNRKF